MTTILTVLRGDGERLDAELTRVVTRHLCYDKTACLFVDFEPCMDLSNLGLKYKYSQSRWSLQTDKYNKTVLLVKDTKELPQRICGYQLNLVVTRNLNKEPVNFLHLLSRLRSANTKDLDFLILLNEDEKLFDDDLESLLPKSGESKTVVRVDGKWVACEDFGLLLRYMEY